MNDDEARIVRTIFHWWTSERLPMREIARRLNEMGAPLPTNPVRKNKTGQRIWRNTTIRFFLTNETFIGAWWFGKRIAGRSIARNAWVNTEVPAIVSREQFDLAQDLLNAYKERRARATKWEHLMARRIECGECHKTMMARGTVNQKGYLGRYYLCAHGKGMRWGTRCPGRVSAKKVDDAIWQWVKGLFSEPQRLTKGIRDYQQAQAEQNEPLREQLEMTHGCCKVH